MGGQPPGEPSDHLPSHPEGGAPRREAVRGGSPADPVCPVGGRVARSARRSRHCARQRHGAGHHPRGSGERAVRGPRHRRVRRLPALGGGVHAGARGGPHRGARGGDPRGGHHLRPVRPLHHLLDARDHRAPQRGRQRAGPHQPVPAHRSRGAIRLGPQPAARPEQRPGRRRHGRLAQPVRGLPGPAGPRRQGALRGGLEGGVARPLWLEPDARCSRPWSAAT